MADPELAMLVNMLQGYLYFFGIVCVLGVCIEIVKRRV